MARDPVCGMNVDDKRARFKSEHQGVTYFFCSAGCKKTFDENPRHYATSEKGGSHEQHR